MEQDFHSSPVPVRMTCRYSNGVVVSYGARALATGEGSVQVLSAEPFEAGIHLNLLAPFLDGIVPCQVQACDRSRRQPPYFELSLKFLKKAASRTGPQEAPKSVVRPPIPGEVAAAAGEMAGLLEREPGPRFSQALGGMPPVRRPAALLVGAAAVMVLLQKKGLFDTQLILERVKGDT